MYIHSPLYSSLMYCKYNFCRINVRIKSTSFTPNTMPTSMLHWLSNTWWCIQQISKLTLSFYTMS